MSDPSSEVVEHTKKIYFVAKSRSNINGSLDPTNGKLMVVSTRKNTDLALALSNETILEKHDKTMCNTPFGRVPDVPSKPMGDRAKRGVDACTMAADTTLVEDTEKVCKTRELIGVKPCACEPAKNRPTVPPVG